MVRNKVGMMYGKDDCFEVMRICCDLDIIAMLHDHDAIVTPNKVDSLDIWFIHYTCPILINIHSRILH